MDSSPIAHIFLEQTREVFLIVEYLLYYKCSEISKFVTKMKAVENSEDQNYFLFDLILYVPSTIFQLCGD